MTYETATEEELFAELARLKNGSFQVENRPSWMTIGVGRWTDLATIDGIAVLWPEGWKWTHEHDDDGVLWWFAKGPGKWYVSVPDTGNERLDRLRLTVMVLAEIERSKR